MSWRGLALLLLLGGLLALVLLPALRGPALAGLAELYNGARLALYARSDAAECRAELEGLGATFHIPPSPPGGRCAVAGAVNLQAVGPVEVVGAPLMSCSAARALAGWLTSARQEAAAGLGQDIRRLHHLGTYNCRTMRGGRLLSEHAFGNAIDVSALTLADGQRVSIARDWTGEGPAALFLRRIRDRACDHFSVALSPDSNADHLDHLHLDGAPLPGGDCRWSWLPRLQR